MTHSFLRHEDNKNPKAPTSPTWLPTGFRINDLGACAIITAVAAGLFYPVVQTYAYTDVYEFLFNAKSDSFVNVFIQGGRPVYGLLNKFFLSAVSSLEGLFWLRIFGATGVLVATLVFYRQLRQLFGQNIAILVAIGFLFSPAANAVAIWMATYLVGWAAAFALISGQLAMQLIVKEQPRNAISVAAAFLLALTSLMIYQPSFTAFIIPGLLHFLKKRDLRSMAWFVGANIAMYVTYFGVHLLILNITTLPPLERTGFADPFDKFSWFFTKVLKLVYQDALIFCHKTAQRTVGWLFVLPACALVVSLFQRKAIGRTVGDLAVLMMFLFLCYVPNLIAVDNEVSFRTLLTLFMFKWTITTAGLEKFPNRHGLATILLLSCVILLGVNSWFNIRHGFVDIQAKEYRVIRSEVVKLIPEMEKTGGVNFVMPNLELLVEKEIIRRYVSDEFSSLSSSRPWVPGPMVRQILLEAGKGTLAEELEVQLRDDGNQPGDVNRYPTIIVKDLYLKDNE